MAKTKKSWLPELFIILVLILVAIGVLMTYSSSVYYAELKFNNKYHFFYREIFWVSLGIFFAIVINTVHYQTIQKYSWIILLSAIVLLLMIYIPGLGKKVNNASRWLRFAGLSFQPSEFTKFAVIIFLADRLAKNRRHVDQFTRGVLFPLIVVMIPVFLIVIEPDLGTPMVILATTVAIFFVAGTKLIYLLFLFIASIPAIILLVVKFPYRMRRLLSFINPDSDPLGAGFQIRQSLIAMGSGQVNGLGLGKSIQKMHYLPEAHTDFVFAIIGEELGFVGAGMLIILFMLFIYITYKLTQQITDMFGHLVAVGIMTILSLQIIVNICVVIALLPTKGLALPFISYGGSSMVVTLMACGLLINIVYNQKHLIRDHKLVRTIDETVI